MPIVFVERGHDKGKRLALEAGKSYVFGRGPKDVSFPLTDSLASRQHFQIRTEDGTATIRDLSSTNGTFLNDERVEVAQLKVGDKIQVGDTIISYLTDKKEETAQGLVAKTIGGYQLLERVGRGGMGTVYRATQLSLNREVAFKVLSARLLKDVKFIDRFKSEARAAGQMNHPNIVQVYDVGTDKTLHFFSMEFMDGGSLQDKVGRDGKLDWEETLDTLSQAASALVFAERSGIVHRDVKPDNLMLSSDGQVKLADLGLARRRDDSEAEEGIFGTPHFISPEQAQGKEIDHRADLYSLGATAYRLLSGRTPFHGSDISEIIRQQINDAPPPLRKACPEAPEELIAVIEKLMEKDPEHRYASAADLREDLENIRLKYHLKAHGVGGGKGVFIAVGLALVAVIAVLIFALSQNGGEPPPQQPMAGGTGNNPRPSTTGNTERPPDVITTDPKALAEAAFLKVKLAETDLGKLAETWKPRRAEWLRLATSYESVGEKYPETESGKLAAARAKFISAEIDRQEKAVAARVKAGETAWESHRTLVEDALARRSFADALKFAEAARDDARIKDAAADLAKPLGQIQVWLAKVQNAESICGRFQAAWERTKADITDLQARAEYGQAAAKGREFLKIAAGEEERAPFGLVRAEFDSLLVKMRTEFRDKLLAIVKADRELYFKTYYSIRHAADPSLGFPDNPVVEFRFAEAAARMAALLDGEPGIASDPYRDRVRKKVEALRAADALMDAMVVNLAKPGGRAELDLPRQLRGGSNVKRNEIDRSADPVVSREGIALSQQIRVGGNVANAKKFLRWDEFTAEELWQHIFLSGKRWTLTSKEAAGAAHFLSECGVAEGLAEMMQQAGTGLAAPQRGRLDRELAAMRDWGKVVALRADGKPPQAWLEGMLRFVERHATTDYFIRVYGFDGPGDRNLLPANVVDDWVEEQLKVLDKNK